MKKFILLNLLALLLSTNVNAWEVIPLCVNYNEEGPIGNGNPKFPMFAPTVYIEDHILLFEANHADYVLNIRDENGNVVYFTVVFSTQTQVVLPSMLSGNYEIEIIMGYWQFKGRITL